MKISTLCTSYYQTRYSNSRKYRKFESPQRRDKTNGKLVNVVSDGVLPLVIQNLPLGSPLTYDKSVFYEVKALSGGLLPLVMMITKF
ncbi:MAG: hypothetical protein CLLPBCKN_008082 [Chroococcidiopsis cubana SAG 39.79]|nr:hypothetical protein [Chroococcidiopsis cubana SAG 39.79]